MKLLAKLWWVSLLILVATWYSHGKARDEVEEFESYYGGCSGFAEGLVHGFIGTGEAQMNRIETRYSELQQRTFLAQRLLFELDRRHRLLRLRGEREAKGGVGEGMLKVRNSGLPRSLVLI